MKTVAALALVGVCFADPQVGPPRPPSVASNRIEGLTDATVLALTDKYTLSLEPGVYARHDAGAFRIASYSGRKIRIRTGVNTFDLDSPATLALSPEGWTLEGGRTLPTASLCVTQSQDDADSNLKSMQEAAKKLKSKNPPAQDNPATRRMVRTRWLFQENPMPTAELFNTAAIQQLTHISAIGF